ncbi:MAG: hypothetical protein ACI4TD_11380, partial [Phocaeicola sp.]
VSLVVGLKATYSSCTMQNGDVIDAGTTEPPVDTVIPLDGKATTTLLREGNSGLACGDLRNRSDVRLTYPEAWTVTINGETFELGEVAELTVGGTTYKIINNGLPVVDFDCPCTDSEKGQIRVNATLEANDYVTAVTLPYTATEQGESTPAISSSVQTPNPGYDTNSVFPSTYNIGAGTPVYQGDNETCQMAMTGPTPSSVTVVAGGNPSVVDFTFKCTGDCMPDNEYNVTVNERLSDNGNVSGKGWSSTSGTTNLKGGSTFDISFNGIVGYEVQSIKITKGDGGVENLPAAQQGYSTKICEDITIDIIYKAPSLKLVVGTLSASYPSNSTGTTPTATLVGEKITITASQDVDVTGISVVADPSTISWIIVQNTDAGWSVSPPSGEKASSTPFTLNVSQFHTSGGCFYAQSTTDPNLKSNTLCFDKDGSKITASLGCNFTGVAKGVKIYATCPGGSSTKDIPFHMYNSSGVPVGQGSVICGGEYVPEEHFVIPDDPATYTVKADTPIPSEFLNISDGSCTYTGVNDYCSANIVTTEATVTP